MLRFDKFVGNEFGQRKRAALELARSEAEGESQDETSNPSPPATNEKAPFGELFSFVEWQSFPV